MKKLMITLAAVVAGVAANAASFNWSATSGRLFDGTGTTGSAGYSPSIGLTAYLFDAATYSQSALVTALNSASGVDYSKAIAGATTTVNSDARIDGKAFSYDVSASFDAYFVVVAADKVFISDTTPSGIQASATQEFEFGSLSTPSKSTFTTSTYGSSGWYQAASAPVPEPTSGLLMLLGMAGLALRRRHA